MTGSLPTLVDQELASVVFVRDYLQLGFDGPTLSLYVWPDVTLGSTVRRLPDPGYRDALCALIGHSVVGTAENAEVGLVVDFGVERITVKPDPASLFGVEIAELSGIEWMVWRAGEAPFDGPEWV